MEAPRHVPSPLAGAPTAGLQPANAVAPPLQGGAPNEELRGLAQEFEALVLAELMGPMFANLDSEGLGGGGMGERMFRPMLVQEYAGAMARAGGVGLAEALLRELMQTQTNVVESDGADR